MADLDQQTEEALGWAAEGKKLAVDIPEVSFKDAATFVASVTPIIGDAMAAKEVYDELQKDEPNYYLAGALGGAALVGLVPGLGDAAAKAIKKGAKEVFDVAKRVEVDPKKTSRNTDAVVDPVLEADDIITEWEKGNISNTELRSRMRDKGFEIHTKRIGPKMTGVDLEVLDPRTNMIDTWNNIPTSDKTLTSFNKGGAVITNSEDQMSTLFDEGGIADDGASIDPVSGNEIPPGSMASEVRDDIPAQLSEGEYVVPADVVRFFGVKFFEDLRTEAKMGFNSMESNGRIGGEPVGMEMGGDELPFDISELQIIDDGEPEQPMMNKGGFISGYAPGGLVDTGDIPLTEENYQGTGMEQRQYTNAAGNIITILFFNGMPMSAIPDGYSSYTPEADAAATQAKAQSGGDSDGPDPVKDPDPIDYKGLSAAELRDLVDAQKDTNRNAISLGLGMLNPLMGMAFKAATWHQSKLVTQELERRMEDPSLDAKQKAFYTDLTETMTADQPGLFERLFGKTEEAKKPEVAAPVAPPVMSPAEVEAAMTYAPTATEPYSYTPEAGYTPAATAAETAEVKAANDQLAALRTAPDSPRGSDIVTQPTSDDDGVLTPTESARATFKSRVDQVKRDRAAARVSVSEGTDARTDDEGKETYTSKVKRGGGFSEGGLASKPKKKK